MTIRPATICGYSPRMRLDLSVNILTNHAVNKGAITVFGGEQLRPNLHIQDMTHPEDRPRDDELRARLFRAEIDSYSIEKRYIRRDASLIWVSVTFGTLLWPGD